MKTIFNIIAMLIIITVAFLAIQNSDTVVNFNAWGTEGVNAKIFSINLVTIILSSLSAGMFAGACWLASYYFAAQNTLKEYKRKLEKTSVQSSCDSSKVEVLQAKIEVLEKALKSALDQND